MNYAPFQQPPNLAEEDGAEEQEQERPCKQGHRASLQLRTSPGGCICLLCFSNLLAEPSALLIHRAYAVSQLLQALDDAMFRDSLLQNHRHFLVSPLTHAICTCSDETLAKDITDIIVKLCTIIAYDDDAMVLQDFLHHLLLQLASSAIVWTRGQTYAVTLLPAENSF